MDYLKLVRKTIIVLLLGMCITALVMLGLPRLAVTLVPADRGMLVSLLGLGLAPMDACCAAVWIHGRAGDMAAEEKGRRGMTPADMIEKLPYALKEVE